MVESKNIENKNKIATIEFKIILAFVLGLKISNESNFVANKIKLFYGQFGFFIVYLINFH